MGGTRRGALVCVALGLPLSVAAPGPGQVRFEEVGASRGLEAYTMAYGMGGGAAAADYDDDGDVDVFVPNGLGVPDQLYRNTGDGGFEEVAAIAGLASTGSDRAALWLDYDGDHDLDLLVAKDCWHAIGKCTDLTSLRLYRQGPPGLFEDVTLASGLYAPWLTPDFAHVGGLCAGDVNGDGFLDVLLSGWDNPLRLFLNGSDGTFREVAAEAGLGGSDLYWQPALADFDGDGRLDVLVLVDFHENLLFLNRGDGTFDEVAGPAGLANLMNDMGLALGDYDNDGDLDLYVTNIFENDDGVPEHNVLYRNDSAGGTLAFTEVAIPSGVGDGGWGWGTTFLDADNDGRLDLAATNGWFEPTWINDPSRFFWNLGGDPVAFLDLSGPAGFDDTFYGSALIGLDHDRDGDVDLLQTCADGGPLRLLDNRPAGKAAGHRHLVIRPRMPGPNHRAIGAVVRVTAGGASMMRLITAGTSFLGQEPAEACFGVGDAPVAGAVCVHWPDGTHRALAGVVTNRVLTVRADGNHADLDGDGTVGIVDLLLMLARWGACPEPGHACAGDLDADGGVGGVDLELLLINWGWSE